MVIAQQIIQYGGAAFDIYSDGTVHLLAGTNRAPDSSTATTGPTQQTADVGAHGSFDDNGLFVVHILYFADCKSWFLFDRL